MSRSLHNLTPEQVRSEATINFLIGQSRRNQRMPIDDAP
jgi:hypothetical protein